MPSSKSFASYGIILLAVHGHTRAATTPIPSATGVFNSSSLITRLPSATTQNPTVITQSASVTGYPECCIIQPDFVGLNIWHNTTYTATVATVITQYLEYNDTVVPNTTTIYNTGPDATWSIPSSILPGAWMKYTKTFTANYSTIDYETILAASPTPFVVITEIKLIPGISTTRSGTPYCGASPVAHPPDWFYHMSEPYVWIPEPTTVWTVEGAIDAPTNLIDNFASQSPDVVEKYPWLTTCSVATGTGQPSVHVPVTALTSHSTKTVKMSGGLGGGKPTSRPPPPPPPQQTEDNDTQGPEPTQRPPQSNPQLPSQPPAPPASTRGPNPPGTPERPPVSPENSQQPPENQPTQNQPGPTQNPNPNPNPNPNNPDTNPAPVTSPAAPIPIPVAPVPSTPGVILPDGNTLAPGETTTISGHEIFVPTDVPSTIVVDGTSVAAPPNVVVVDGTTVPVADQTTVLVDAPPRQGTPRTIVTEAPVESITLGGDVIPIVAPTATGEGIELPNGETLMPGSTTIIDGSTIQLDVSPSTTQIQIIDGTTTQNIPLYTPTTITTAGTETNKAPNASGTEGAPEFTGAASSFDAAYSWMAALGFWVLM